MVGIPETFTRLSPSISSYNYVDIASGTGYITLYAGSTVDLYLLSNTAFYSDVIRNYTSCAGGVSDQLCADIDFDIELNKPMNVAGLGIVNVPVAVSTVGANTASVYAVVYFRKWNGSTETEIVSNTSRTHSGSNSSASTPICSMLAVDLDVPLTHFKIGETLRLTVKIYGSNSAGVNSSNIWWAYDPMNRTSGWDTTGAVPSRLLFLCPVRLNL